MATQKTTKKKAAKKTFPSAKKTNVPRLKKKSTVEELAAVMAKSHAKTEAAIERLSESHAKTEAAIAGLAENHAKTEAEVKKMAISIDKLTENVNRLNDNVGNVNNRLGRIVELVIAPKIRCDINTVGGHNFSHVETDTLVRGIVNGRKEDIAEVDVLLRGATEVMAVELKTRLRENHVRDHIDRLHDLRDHEEDVDIKGKKLLGAVGGVVIDEKAKNLAKQRGLYIIEIREEKEAIDITKPEECQAW